MDKYLVYVEKIRTFMNIPLGQEVFDPRMIISQMCLLQTSSYLAVGVILLILNTFVGYYVSLEQLVHILPFKKKVQLPNFFFYFHHWSSHK
jgi:hypothetical protein